jgi:anti-sigma factor RsiW
MNDAKCHMSRDLLASYLDNELPGPARAEMALHLTQCTECQVERDAMEALRQRLAAAGPHPLTAGLEARINAALDAESPLQPNPERSRPWSSLGPMTWPRLAALAASHAAVALLTAGLLYGMLSGTDERDRALHEIVNAHARAALTNQMVQVASSDTHTVKPWLAARLPYSPNVHDYKPQGFPLLGGRIDFLLDEPVASLVYGRREHLITVFVVPLDRASTLAVPAANWRGYHVIGWRDASFSYLATTDLNLSELKDFVVLAGGS